MGTLFLIRHAQTRANAGDLFCGSSDEPLSALGETQALALGRRLANEEIAQVFSSPLQRACATALEIARRHNLGVTKVELLREQSGGSFEGRPLSEYRRAREQSGRSALEYAAPNGESMLDVRARAASFWKSVRGDLNRGRGIAVVSHRAFGRMLLSIILEQSPEDAAHIALANACCCVLVFDERQQLTDVRLNCTDHLTPGSAGFSPADH